MIITHELSLDVKKNNTKIVQIPQYNKDTHKLVISLTDDGQSLTLPTQDYEAWLKIAGYGGNYYQLAMEMSTENNTVSIVLPESVVAFPGKHNAQIDIKNPTTHEQVSTLPFYIKVPDSVYSDNVVIKVGNFGELNRLIDRANNQLEGIQTVIDAANDNIAACNQALENINSEFTSFQTVSGNAIDTFNTNSSQLLTDIRDEADDLETDINGKASAQRTTIRSDADTLLATIRSEANTLEGTITTEASDQRDDIQDAADALMSTINTNANTRLQEIQDEAEQVVDAGLSGGFNVTPITGTNATASNIWTGNYNASGLAVGKQILYTLPVGSTAGIATLELTLSDNTTTGAIPVKNIEGQNITTGYGQGRKLLLLYDGSDWIVLRGSLRKMEIGIYFDSQIITSHIVHDQTNDIYGLAYTDNNIMPLGSNDFTYEAYLNGLRFSEMVLLAYGQTNYHGYDTSFLEKYGDFVIYFPENSSQEYDLPFVYRATKNDILNIYITGI